MTTYAFWWAIAGIVLMLSEFVVPGLVLFFFGVGALLTALVSWVAPSLSLELQIGIFIVFSLATLFGLRRFLKPIFMGRSSGNAADDERPSVMIGTQGEVSEAIEPGRYGRVVINGAGWKADALEPLPKGTLVEIVDQKNLTLTVRATTAITHQKEQGD